MINSIPAYLLLRLLSLLYLDAARAQNPCTVEALIGFEPMHAGFAVQRLTYLATELMSIEASSIRPGEHFLAVFVAIYFQLRDSPCSRSCAYRAAIPLQPRFLVLKEKSHHLVTTTYTRPFTQKSSVKLSITRCASLYVILSCGDRSAFSGV